MRFAGTSSASLQVMQNHHRVDMAAKVLVMAPVVPPRLSPATAAALLRILRRAAAAREEHRQPRTS
jgi:hypothetical protein